MTELHLSTDQLSLFKQLQPFTWGSCRSPPRSRLRLFWKKEWISAFSMEVVRSMESSERAFSSHRVREKVKATTGVCWRWDRKCSSVSHTARSWRETKRTKCEHKNCDGGWNQEATQDDYLAGGGVLRRALCAE